MNSKTFFPRRLGNRHGQQLAEVVLSAVDTFESMLSAYQKDVEPPTPAPLRTLIHELLRSAEGVQSSKKSAAGSTPARFDWSEYERLMISEALLAATMFFNIALRVDPNSSMRAAAFSADSQCSSHLRPPLLLSGPRTIWPPLPSKLSKPPFPAKHPIDHISHRCKIPAVVSEVRIEAAEHAESTEHELLGDLLEAQAAQISSRAADVPGPAPPIKAPPPPAVATVSEKLPPRGRGTH